MFRTVHVDVARCVGVGVDVDGSWEFFCRKTPPLYTQVFYSLVTK